MCRTTRAPVELLFIYMLMHCAYAAPAWSWDRSPTADDWHGHRPPCLTLGNSSSICLGDHEVKSGVSCNSTMAQPWYHTCFYIRSNGIETLPSGDSASHTMMLHSIQIGEREERIHMADSVARHTHKRSHKNSSGGASENVIRRLNCYGLFRCS